jgi:hypothetical protein
MAARLWEGGLLLVPRFGGEIMGVFVDINFAKPSASDGKWYYSLIKEEAIP